jgi:ribosomal protein S18 acetylase RimI-like enzyme
VTERDLELRPVEPGDDELLCRIYRSTREAELSQVDWSDAQKETFLRMQFEAQRRHYEDHYDGASFDVVLVDGTPAGRLYVAREPEEIRIVDIALLPEYRNVGIGTELLRRLLDEGAVSGKRLTIHVESHNPARRLYERLGFAPVGNRGAHVLMTWSPPADPRRRGPGTGGPAARGRQVRPIP